MKKLTTEDSALWRHVKKSIKPLRHTTQEAQEEILTFFLPPSFTPRFKKAETKPLSTNLKPLAPFEKNIKRGLKRKQVDVQAKLDLHGLFQEAAHLRLKHFLQDAQQLGYRLVIVVTGKGASGTSILRQNVPQWLAMPDLRSVVMGFEEAEQHHGGEGALYVRIRRKE